MRSLSFVKTITPLELKSMDLVKSDIAEGEEKRIQLNIETNLVREIIMNVQYSIKEGSLTRL
jgi:hypothetical protein